MMICIFSSKKGIESEETECGSTVEEDSKSSIDMSKPYYNPKGLNWFVTGLFVVGDLAGGGLVALPTAMIQSQFWPGLIMTIIMIIAATFTSHVLGKSWNILVNTWPEYREHCRRPYPEIANRACGPIMRNIVSGCIDLTQFMIGVVYLLLSSKNIHDFIKAFFGGNLSFCIVILILAAVLLPVLFLKSPADFWWAVVIAMMTTSCAVILIIIGASIDWGVCEPVKHMPSFRIQNYFLSLGTILFSVGGHSAFPTIQSDMKDPSQFTKSSALAFAIMACMYIPVCIIGYIVYGDSLMDSVIPSIQTVGIQQAINVLITVHCILTLTIVCNPLSQEIEEFVGAPQHFSWQRVAVRTSLVIAIAFAAESVPNFGPLLDLVGGSTLTLTSVIFPCLFYLFLTAYKEKEEDTGVKGLPHASISDVFTYVRKPTLIFCLVVMTIGIIGGGAATYSAIEELSTTQFTMPCYVSLFQHKGHPNDNGQHTNCCGATHTILAHWKNATSDKIKSVCSMPQCNFYGNLVEQCATACKNIWGNNC
ncbi:hypothetical protein WR25_04139 [Diploscapter pachys]|uniref:Amino acid transporter transmembrane domain-containing protein n=1 Tax=Diploscapter pachys TaxID=2018661 RepID=A0A2A2JV21_9BILA|nr:hypothetical protein WR25_04139 [Diploscapter pachys]